MELKNILLNALKKKSPDELIAVSKKSELKNSNPGLILTHKISNFLG